MGHLKNKKSNRGKNNNRCTSFGKCSFAESVSRNPSVYVLTLFIIFFMERETLEAFDDFREVHIYKTNTNNKLYKNCSMDRKSFRVSRVYLWSQKSVF